MSAMFEFSGGGLSVVPSGGDAEISFELYNVGTESGVAEVGIEVDGHFYTTWNSTELYPGFGDTPRITVGPIAPGSHEALIYVNPGSGQNDHLRQSFGA